MRQSFVALYDDKFRTVYFPPEYEAAETYGRYPWEFADPEYVEIIKESFRQCVETDTPQFHIAKLGHNTYEYAGLCLCAWLTPVKISLGCSLLKKALPEEACSTPCATVLAKCVVVPPVFHELSPRERDVLVKLSNGISPNRIAADLGLARSTIDTLLGRIRKKLNVEDSLQVAHWATVYRDILHLDPKICGDHLHKKSS